MRPVAVRQVQFPRQGPEPRGGELPLAEVVEELTPRTDIALYGRLVLIIGRRLEAVAARDVAAHTVHLYRLLADRSPDQPDRPVDRDLLRRALTLAWTRPADDPCWQDYLAVRAAVDAQLATTSERLPRNRTAQRLRWLPGRRTSPRVSVDAADRATRQFTDRWRASSR